MCPNDQKYEPGARRRRDVTNFNSTLSEIGSRVSGRFRVISPDDIAELQNREHLVSFIPGNLQKDHSGKDQ